MIWIDLQDLLPTVYKKITSMFEAAQTESEELENLMTIAEAIRDNFFIQTCDETTLRTYEKLLEITVAKADTLTTRRARVLAELNNNQPYTMPFLKEQANLILGIDAWEISVKDNVLTATIKNCAFDSIESFVIFVNRIKPAHILVGVNIVANTPIPAFLNVYGQVGNVIYANIPEKNIFGTTSVYIAKVTNNKVSIVKSLKTFTGLANKEAKTFIDNSPCVIDKFTKKESAAGFVLDCISYGVAAYCV